MSDAQHTPAPWEWNSQGQLVAPNSRDPDYPDEPILIVETDSGFYPPKAADRPLIATSPELLAELRAMTDAYAKAMRDAGFTRNPEALAEVRRARVVIAKATRIAA